ncbi:MAG: hypothetical protein WDZ88_03595 [Candidatus Paceibacterota bacterium]
MEFQKLLELVELKDATSTIMNYKHAIALTVLTEKEVSNQLTQLLNKSKKRLERFFVGYK